MNRYKKIGWLLSGALLLGTVGCKNQREVVSQYNYLIKEDGKTKPVEKVEAEVKVEEPVIKSDFRVSVDKVIQEAESYLGTPYRYGGINKNGIDCSGLMHNSYRVAGVTLPRSSRDQANEGQAVSRNALEPGDLVFFSSNNTKQIDHVGLVTKVKGSEVTFIHASTSAGVRFDRLDEGYWKNLFVKARRPQFN